uniref:hypothetical protein n=1 Tax=Altererythrobacter segetis TaxID=1104773 RepID=UPI001408599D|nr:hypothetical protein [Altererythrobacter segetis]
MRKTGLAAIAAIGIATATPAVAQDSTDQAANAPFTSFSLMTGVDYSSGDYGTGLDTNILVVPATARLTTGNLRFGATLPWLRIDGANVIGGADGGPIVIDPNAPRTIRKGIGDLSLSATYAIPEESIGVGLEFTGRVKMPTGSQSKGLSTGKTDLSASVDLSKTFGIITPFIDVGHKWAGDPSYIDLNNTWFGSVGASVALGNSVLLASYDYREATSPLSEDSQEVFGAFGAPVSKHFNLTVYGSAGLSEGAPDYGAGGMVTLKM